MRTVKRGIIALSFMFLILLFSCENSFISSKVEITDVTDPGFTIETIDTNNDGNVSIEEILIGEGYSGGNTERGLFKDLYRKSRYYAYDNSPFMTLEGSGGIDISANMWEPIAKEEGQRFPAIIMLNSWSVTDQMYLIQAHKFALKGYIILTYSARGWGLSDGEIEMWRNPDQEDFAKILDWLIENSEVDVENIATFGVSYGGGGALLTLSNDERVKTCAAASFFTDQFSAMYSNSTPRKEMCERLLTGVSPLGSISEETVAIFKSAYTNSNIDYIWEYCQQSSPMAKIDQINNANKPVYLSHNFGDYMFPVDFSIEYFNKLTVDHKRLDLNQGGHTTHEIPGIAGVPIDMTMGAIHDWMDFWLKGEDTGIIQDSEKSGVITVQKKCDLKREIYNSEELLTMGNGSGFQWPPSSVRNKTFYLWPSETDGKDGVIKSQIYAGEKNTIIETHPDDSGASIGSASVSPVFESYYIKKVINSRNIDRSRAAVYITDNLDEELNIRGKVSLNTNVSFSNSKGQLISYLYELDNLGFATFISHGFMTYWDVVPGEIYNTDLSFLANAYDLDKGKRLMVVIDTQEDAYGKPTEDQYNVTFHHSTDIQSTIVVPVK